MAKIPILVNPPSLLTSAKTITTIASSVQKAGDLAWRSASGAPSYDGQFGPKVRALGQAALARAKKQSASTNLLSSSLSKRAKAFQAADSAAVKGLRSNPYLKVLTDPFGLAVLTWLTGLSISQINRLLKLGQLGSLGMPWKPIPVYAATSADMRNKPSNISKYFGSVWSWITDRWNDLFGPKEEEKEDETKDEEDTKKDESGEIDNRASQLETYTLPIYSYSGKQNCYLYVKHQREKNGLDTPSGFGEAGKGLYDGSRHGQSGTYKSNGVTYKYGQEPRLGAIMVESPKYSSGYGVDIGHVSIISEIKCDDTGKVISYTISEINFKSPAKTFTWNPETQRFENGRNRNYDFFIY